LLAPHSAQEALWLAELPDRAGQPGSGGEGGPRVGKISHNGYAGMRVVAVVPQGASALG
jgi:hypothetical protein